MIRKKKIAQNKQQDRKHNTTLMLILFHALYFWGGTMSNLWSTETEYTPIMILSTGFLAFLFIAYLAHFIYKQKHQAIITIPLLMLFIWDLIGMLAALIFAHKKVPLDFILLLAAPIITAVTLSQYKEGKKKRDLIYIIPLYSSIIITTLIILFSATLYLIYPNRYAYHILVNGSSDTLDYQIFPSRKIKNSGDTDPLTVNLDRKEEVEDLFKSVEVEDLDKFAQKTESTSLIVYKDSELIYENYFNDQDRNDIATSFSMAKSIDSLLVGCAIADGHIESVDDSITKYLPELEERDPNFSKIKIKHLLMMNSGIAYSDSKFLGVIDLPSDDNPKTYYYPDLRDLALNQTTVDTDPGSYFQYNNYNPLLIGVILERATGMSASEYLEKKIWTTSGMEFSASWSLDSSIPGLEKMESGINARPIDYVKIGVLLLNNGLWNQNQIIDPAWIKLTTQPTTENSDKPEDYYQGEITPYTENMYYSYYWWGFEDENQDQLDDFLAIGHLGQYLYISPKNDLLILRTGKDSGDIDWPSLFNKISTNLENNPDL